MAINAVAWSKINHPEEINLGEAMLGYCDRSGLHGNEARKIGCSTAGDVPDPFASLAIHRHICTDCHSYKLLSLFPGA